MVGDGKQNLKHEPDVPPNGLSIGKLKLSPTCLRYGLVVRIAGSHPAGPGSIPGNGKLFGHPQQAQNRGISSFAQQFTKAKMYTYA